MSKNSVYAQVSTKENKDFYKAITSKQWQVYYYFLSISKYNAQLREDHRYIYKSSLNVSAAKFLGIGRTTIYRAIETLQKYRLILSKDEYYFIYAKDYVSINTETLLSLLRFSRISNKNIDLLRIYLSLKKMNDFTKTEERSFTKRDMIVILGHNTQTPSEYEDIRNYLALLSYLNLIELKTHVATDKNFGGYIIYHLQSVAETSNHPDMTSSLEKEMSGSCLPEKVIKVVQFAMPEFSEE